MKKTLLILLFLGLIVQQVTYSQSNYTDLMTKGATSYQQKQYEEAYNFFEKAQILNPRDTTVALYTAIVATQLGKNTVVISQYEKYLSNGGKESSAYYALAMAYQTEKLYEKALSMLYRGMNDFPTIKNEFKAERVNLLLRIGKTDEAIVGMKEMMELDPMNATYVTNIGTMYENLSSTYTSEPTKKSFYKNLAVEYYNKALKIDSNNYDALYNLGVAYFNDAVAVKKTVDDMDMATYKKEGKAVEQHTYGLFLTAKTYFDRAYAIKQENDVAENLKTLSSVIKKYKDDGLTPSYNKNTPIEDTKTMNPTEVVAKPTKADIPSTSSVGQNRVALVIGNSAYSHGSQLNNLPINDAQDISARLKELGFTVITTTNATHEKLMDSFRQFGKASLNADVALFFYAGHGIEAEGINYLIPIDAKLEDPADARFESVSLNVILDEMKRFKTKVNLVYLDACRNNPFRSWSRDAGGRGFAQVGRLAQSTKVYYATQPGDVAQNGTNRNGRFTSSLLRYLKKGIEIEDLMREVTIDVIKNTNSNQQPFSAGTLLERFEF